MLSNPARASPEEELPALPRPPEGFMPELTGVNSLGVVHIDDEAPIQKILGKFLSIIIPNAPFTSLLVERELTLELLKAKVVELLSLDTKLPPAAILFDYHLSYAFRFTGTDLLRALNEHFAHTKHKDAWGRVIRVVASAAVESEIEGLEDFNLVFPKTELTPGSIRQLLVNVEGLLESPPAR